MDRFEGHDLVNLINLMLQELELELESHWSGDSLSKSRWAASGGGLNLSVEGMQQLSANFWR